MMCEICEQNRRYKEADQRRAEIRAAIKKADWTGEVLLDNVAFKKELSHLKLLAESMAREMEKEAHNIRSDDYHEALANYRRYYWEKK